MPDEVRDAMVARIMTRDHVSKDAATKIVNRLAESDLVRLEMETRERAMPSFTADYDPYGRDC